MDVCDQLFRREAGRMVSVLTRIFGLRNLALAEDVVQDAFRRAIEAWPRIGLPDDPAAWIMTTAKRRALDVLRRERTARTNEPEISWMMQSEWTLAPMLDESFSEAAIKDDQLRMMFSCCHPQLVEEAQVALILHILCGFSVHEIASAFLSGVPAIEKRVVRSKRVLARSKHLFEIDGPDFPDRLVAVQRALYLLFNEGYHSSSPEAAVRSDLCREAMRLAALLVENPRSANPATFALAALLCFNAARLPARQDDAGRLMPFLDQDRSRWDRQLMAEGRAFLAQSATGVAASDYHLEAAIASLHASAARPQESDWRRIVALYDSLLERRPSPVIALNRAIAIGEAEGPERALQELRAIPDTGKLARYPFHAAALGEYELRAQRPAQARAHFERALTLARNPVERDFLARRLAACRSASRPVSPESGKKSPIAADGAES